MACCSQRAGKHSPTAVHRVPHTLQAFLQRCIKNNADDEDVVMHWTFLAEAHQAGDTATIRTWVDEALKGLG